MVAAKERAPAKNGAISKTPIISLDAGNGYFKLVTPDGAHISFPASVKRLKSFEVDEVRPDATSAIVRLGDKTYAFGTVASQLGGKSLFEIGKAEHTPIAVAAAIALSRLGTRCGVVKLRLLVPDASKQEWRRVEKALPEQVNEFHAEVADGEGMQKYLPRIDEVQLVTEGYPVWHWATRSGQIPMEYSHKPLIGVIDMGTGDATFSVWTQSGSLVREGGVSFAVPAMQKLAGTVAAGFANKTTYTPDRTVILEIIRQQGQKPPQERHYVYEESGESHPFTDILQEELVEFNRDILVNLKTDRWASIWGQLSMIFITGGASDLLVPMERASGGRFRIVRLEHCEPQMTNAALMAYLD